MIATKDNLDTVQWQKATEGLKELACMIAAACRNRATDETIQLLTSSKSSEENISSEIEIMACIELADSHTGYVYTETIEVVNFIRRKAPKKNSKQE